MGQPPAIHAALEGMVTIDTQARIIMINPAALRMFGRTAANTMGQSMEILLPERLREKHQLHVQRFIDSDQIERPMGRDGQLIGLRANGEEFPLIAAICKVALDTEAGPQLCCTALLYDRSKEVALTTEIEQLNQQMRAVFHRAPIAIWITDGDTIAFANQACIRLFGVQSSDQLEGQSIRKLLHVEDQNSDFEWSQDGPNHDDNLLMLSGKIVRPDGSQRLVEVALTPLPDHGKRFAQMVIVDTTLRAKERRNLLHSKHTLRGLAASMVEAREDERQHIARELHDELGQRLMALKMELTANAQTTPTSQASDRTQHMIEMVDETIQSTRSLAMGLRPPMLDDLGLASAVEWLVSDFQNRHQIPVNLRVELPEEPLLATVSISLYRILQEALTNVARHSGAQRVQVDLGLRDKWIQLVVKDDGQGLPESGGHLKRGSFGLIGMRERVRLLSGQMSLKNDANGGAILMVRLPLRAEHENEPPPYIAFDETAPPPESDFDALTPW